MMTLENAERLADLMAKNRVLQEELNFQTPGTRWYNNTISASNEIYIAIDRLIEVINND